LDPTIITADVTKALPACEESKQCPYVPGIEMKRGNRNKKELK
jgi:hypothetical protein